MRNKGLLKFFMAVMLSMALVVVSLVHTTSFHINADFLHTVIIPDDVERDWDESFYMVDKDDIAQVITALNALELRHVRTYTQTSIASIGADISKENLNDFVALQYDVEQKEQVTFLQQHNLPAGIFILKDGHILANYVGEKEVYYKLYQADSEKLLAVLDDMKVKYRDMFFVDDVMQCLALEGIDYTIMSQSETFQQNWPDTTILKLNENHYLLLRSFSMNPEKRGVEQNECGWIKLAPLSETAKAAPFILNQLETDFMLEDIDVVHVAYFNNKNMAAQMIPIIQSDMTAEEWTLLNEEHTMLYSALKRIFTE